MTLLRFIESIVAQSERIGDAASTWGGINDYRKPIFFFALALRYSVDLIVSIQESTSNLDVIVAYNVPGSNEIYSHFERKIRSQQRLGRAASSTSQNTAPTPSTRHQTVESDVDTMLQIDASLDSESRIQRTSADQTEERAIQHSQLVQPFEKFLAGSPLPLFGASCLFVELKSKPATHKASMQDLEDFAMKCKSLLDSWGSDPEACPVKGPTRAERLLKLVRNEGLRFLLLEEMADNFKNYTKEETRRETHLRTGKIDFGAEIVAGLWSEKLSSSSKKPSAIVASITSSVEFTSQAPPAGFDPRRWPTKGEECACRTGDVPRSNAFFFEASWSLESLIYF